MSTTWRTPGVWLAAVLGVSSPASAAPARCPDPVQVFRAGQERGAQCPDEARAAGMTVLDLGDDWAPYPLHGAAIAAGVDPPRYRDTFVALADGDFGGDAQAERDHDLELFGIAPSLRRVLAAMDDGARHRCHDAVDDAALAGLTVTLRVESRARADERREEIVRSRAQIAAALRRHGLSGVDELRAQSPWYERLLGRLARAEQRTAAIDALQRHLACDGLLDADEARHGFDRATARALAVYQRRHWIVASGELDADSRDALRAGSRELDFRLALRVLRQRVVDAAGLLEDGSAAGEWGTVLGRQLDPEDMRHRADSPLPNPAPDHVSPATEAAALALGWRDFDGARAFLRRHVGRALKVAVELPPPPPYYGPAMQLRAVVEPGDPRTRTKRPVLVVYADAGDREVALVRWPTTVGGWKDEKRESGAVVKKYKESDPGPRLWRDLVVAPAWYAPPSTPDDELVGLVDGELAVKQDLIGPGYRSAYGLVMLVHHEHVQHRDHAHMVDRGIRTHGSVSYRSILTGYSHGCHRLYNHHALRLTSFLLRHRSYGVRGPLAETWARRVRYRGREWKVHRDERGFAYELTPPVPIEVHRGPRPPYPRRRAPKLRLALLLP